MILDKTFSNFILAVCLFIIIIYIEEKKKGINLLINSLKNGRLTLFSWRIGIIFIVTFFVTLTIQSQNLLLSHIFSGDLGSFNRYVQSNLQFVDCVYPIKIWQFLLISITVKTIIISILLIAFWLLLLLIKNVMYSILIFMAGIAMQINTYENVNLATAFAYSKYINIAALLDVETNLRTYNNMNIFEKAINVNDLYVLALVIFIILIIPLYYAVIIRKNEGKLYAKIESVKKKISDIKLPLHKHTNLFLHELSKVLFQMRVIIILGIATVIVLNMGYQEKLDTNYALTVYNDYLEQVKGPYSLEKIGYLEAERQLWEEKIIEQEEIIRQYEQEENADSYYFIDEAKNYIKKYNVAKGVVNNIISEGERLSQLIKNDLEVEFINKNEMNKIIGNNSDNINIEDAFIIVLLIILSSSAIFSYDKEYNLNNLINSTKKGRSSLVTSKYIVLCLVVCYIVMVVILNRYSYFDISLFDKKYDMAIQSYYKYNDFNFNITINDFLVILLFLKVIIGISIAFIVALISYKSKNVSASIIISSIIMLFTNLLYLSGLFSAKNFALGTIVAITPIINSFGIDKPYYIIPFFVVVAISIAATFYVHHSINNTVIRKKQVIKRKERNIANS